jgi:phosphoribosylamine---glycine ligase
MKVLVVGSGGREHAIAWGLARGPQVTDIVAAPGNAGMASLARTAPEVVADDIDAVAALADRERPDLVVIGPEAPLVAGLADELRGAGHAVFGPSAAAARIEGSKSFAKEVMARRGVDTARGDVFDDPGKAVAFVDELGGAAVVKADGLAAGKGVTVATDREAAIAAIEACLVDGLFGDAGRRIVVEEVLEGPEVSVFAVTDGTGSCVLLDAVQDHKRIGDGDTGPNTGGMGASSPVPLLDEATATHVLDTVIAPVVDELQPYVGVLFAGMILTRDGPKVLEFNCRFGDPEAQALLPRMPNDLATLFSACANGTLADAAGHAGFDAGAAVSVVLASAGYPASSTTGVPIEGLEEAADVDGALVFHSGTARDADGRLVTAGGRVLAVTGTGPTIAAARSTAYRAADRIAFDGKTYRRDIAAQAARLDGAEGSGRPRGADGEERS